MDIVSNFQKVLEDFFAKHHPRKKPLAEKIAEEFKGEERKVLYIMCDRYNVKPESIEGLVVAPSAPVIEKEEPEALPPAEDEVVEEVNENNESDDDDSDNDSDDDDSDDNDDDSDDEFDDEDEEKKD